MTKFYSTIAAFVLMYFGATAQLSSIRGKLIESKTNNPIFSAEVILKCKGIFIQHNYTDEKGFYEFKSIIPDTYSVSFIDEEHVTLQLDQILLIANMVTDLKTSYLSRKNIIGQVREVIVVHIKNPPLKQGEIGTHISGVASHSMGYSNLSSAKKPTNNLPSNTGTAFRNSPFKIKTNGLQAYNIENAKDISVENGFVKSHKNLLSTFNIDVDRASFSNTRNYLQKNQLPPKAEVRTEEFINYFSYNYPQPSNEQPFSIITEMGICPWNEAHKLLHIGIQGKIIADDSLPPMNLIFLIDISGSMYEPNKLPLIIESLKLLTERLRAEDKISIVTYADGDHLILSGISGQQKDTIRNAINNITRGGGGGTNGSAGIIKAYEVANNSRMKNGIDRIILCTDGDFNLGLSGDEDLKELIEKKRETGISLSVFGFGMGNYKDARMKMLADKGNGNYAFIDKLDEAKKVFIHEIGGTMVTIASDVKIQLEFNPMYVKEYRLIGYESRVLNNEDFSNDKVDAGDLGSGHHVTALYEIIPNLDKTEQGNLKYDKTDITPSKLEDDEWMFVKLRYKNPKDSISKLITHKVDKTMINNPTSNFYFSAAVTEFSMLLRNSAYKGNISYADIIKLATQNTGNDSLGYKKEFIMLVKIAEQLSEKKETKKTTGVF